MTLIINVSQRRRFRALARVALAVGLLALVGAVYAWPRLATKPGSYSRPVIEVIGSEGSQPPFIDLHFVTNEIGWLETRNNYFRTLDGGSSWQFQFRGPQGRILVADRDRVVTDAYEQTPRLFINGAPRSTPAPDAAPEGYLTLAFKSTLEGLAIVPDPKEDGTSPRFYSTLDGGLQWRQFTPHGLPVLTGIDDFAYVQSGAVGIAWYGGGGEPHVTISLNAGQDWKDLAPLPPEDALEAPDRATFDLRAVMKLIAASNEVAGIVQWPSSSVSDVFMLGIGGWSRRTLPPLAAAELAGPYDPIGPVALYNSAQLVYLRPGQVCWDESCVDANGLDHTDRFSNFQVLDSRHLVAVEWADVSVPYLVRSDNGGANWTVLPFRVSK